MDASQITKLYQKQNARYINRCQTVDSSTLTWKSQQQSSSYIQGVRTCSGQVACNIPTQAACSTGNGICSYGGQGKSMTLMTGATQQFPNPLASAAGSASRVYSSENIMLQKAANNICGEAPLLPAPTNFYVVTNICPDECTNSNYSSTIINNQTNPYLPPIDTFYSSKNPCVPSIDQNQKHQVIKCYKCPDDTGMVQIDSSHNYTLEIFNPTQNTNQSVNYTLEALQRIQITYNLCPGGGDIDWPTLPPGTTKLPTIINGPLPPGGTFSVIISPENNDNDTTLLSINPVTGEISWPPLVPPAIVSIGGYYTITYTCQYGTITYNTPINAVECTEPLI
jgi:hypothetical protein